MGSRFADKKANGKASVIALKRTIGAKMSEIAFINGETWLICGGRYFADQALFDSAMGDIVRMYGAPAKVVHGDATGADSMADAWGKQLAIEVKGCKADWKRYGKPAGPIRNTEMMMLHKPQKVIVFPGGPGTADMVRKARHEGADIIEIRMTKATGTAGERS